MSSKIINSIKDMLDFINCNPSKNSNFERFYRGVNKVHTIEEYLPKTSKIMLIIKGPTEGLLNPKYK